MAVASVTVALLLAAGATILFQLLPVSGDPANHGASAYNLRGRRSIVDIGLLIAEDTQRVITVRQDGTGDFSSVGAAVASIPQGNTARTIIRIGQGFYWEKIRIDPSRPYVTFYGESSGSSKPTILYNDTAATSGTWDSASVIVESDYFVAFNMAFQNSAPRPNDGAVSAQAVALRISGDKADFRNCDFIGYQDTLCDDVGRHFFKNCFISGTVDFIFGNGRSLYLKTVIQSVATGLTYITAQARSKRTEDTGFSFVNCNVTGSGSAFLGRAWKDMSRVVFARTYMDALIEPGGWHDHGVIKRQKTVFFAEYKCEGPGSNTDKRVPYSKVLTDEQAKPFVGLKYIDGRTWLRPLPRF